MKKFLLAVMVVAVMSLSSTAYAKGSKDPCKTFLGSVLNECSPHNHEKTVDTWREERKPNAEVGIGVDVVVWENETGKADVVKEVVVEYKYDINNDDHATYGVVKLNLWEKIKGVFKKDVVE